jgi:hypothetical protein
VIAAGGTEAEVEEVEEVEDGATFHLAEKNISPLTCTGSGDFFCLLLLFFKFSSISTGMKKED